MRIHPLRFLALPSLLLACSGGSSSASLVSFVLTAAENPSLISDVPGSVSGTQITVTLPVGTSLSVLVPTIVCNGASIQPPSDTPMDFTKPVTYVVTASDGTTQKYEVTVRPPTQAQISGFAAQLAQAGPTPFIAFVQVRALGLDAGGSIQVTVSPKPGSTSPPVSASYGYAALARRGYASSTDAITVPVYGLYAGATNNVAVEAAFADGSTANAAMQLVAPAYAPPGWAYATPTIAQARVANVALGFSFYLIKSPTGPPVVMDTDGQVRWVGTAVSNSASARFTGEGVVVGDGATPVLRRLELDGTSSILPLAANGWTDFNHDIADGKSGLLVSVDVTRGGRTQVDSVLAEVDGSGAVLQEWSMGDIIARTMSAGGDDPSLFVRDGIDWFHVNLLLPGFYPKPAVT